MLAKIAMGLGYSLLAAAALGGVVYSHTSLALPEVAQLGVFGAGALALLLTTYTRKAK